MPPRARRNIDMQKYTTNVARSKQAPWRSKAFLVGSSQ